MQSINYEEFANLTVKRLRSIARNIKSGRVLVEKVTMDVGVQPERGHLDPVYTELTIGYKEAHKRKRK